MSNYTFEDIQRLARDINNTNCFKAKLDTIYGSIDISTKPENNFFAGIPFSHITEIGQNENIIRITTPYMIYAIWKNINHSHITFFKNLYHNIPPDTEQTVFVSNIKELKE